MLAALAFAAFCFCLLYKTSGGGAKRLSCLLEKPVEGKRKGAEKYLLWREKVLKSLTVKFTTTTTTNTRLSSGGKKEKGRNVH